MPTRHCGGTGNTRRGSGQYARNRMEQENKRSKKDMYKKKGPPWDSEGRGERKKGSETELSTKKKPYTHFYSIHDLEALEIDSSGSEDLDPNEESELEEEATQYKEQRYNPDRWSQSGSDKKE